VKLSLFDHLERDRESPREARCGDAPARLVLAHREPSQAKVEQGRARRLEIEPSFFHLGEVCEQPGE
jgi:hypothetical protein